MSGQWSGEIADVHAKWVNGRVELVWPENERHLQGLADYEAIQALVNEVNQAVSRTEERIIKLLEKRLTGCSGYDCETCGEVEGLTSALALIKGEK